MFRISTKAPIFAKHLLSAVLFYSVYNLKIKNMALRNLDEIDKINIKSRVSHLTQLFDIIVTDNELQLYGYDIQTLNNELHNLGMTLQNIIHKSNEHKNENAKINA